MRPPRLSPKGSPKNANLPATILKHTSTLKARANSKNSLSPVITTNRQEIKNPKAREHWRMLSVDTGKNLKKMIRQQQTVKNFIESAQERISRKATIADPPVLPAINE